MAPDQKLPFLLSVYTHLDLCLDVCCHITIHLQIHIQAAAHWHPTKNHPLTPRDVHGNSYRKYWFQVPDPGDPSECLRSSCEQICESCLRSSCEQICDSCLRSSGEVNHVLDLLGSCACNTCAVHMGVVCARVVCVCVCVCVVFMM